MSLLTFALRMSRATRGWAGRRRPARRAGSLLRRIATEPRFRLGLWTAAIAAACGGLAWAQQAAAPPAAPPPAAPIAAPAPVTAPAPIEAASPVEAAQNAAVDTILATNPQTPEELIRAARILADLNRPDLARSFLGRVLQTNLTPAQSAALVRQMGMETFTRLAARPDLAPEAGQLAAQVANSVREELTAPDQLSSLIKQLSDPSSEVRYRAINQLRPVRLSAMGAILQALADPSRAAERSYLRLALVELGGNLVPSLVGSLETADPVLEAEIISVLGDLRSHDAILYLLAPYYAADADPQVRRAAEAALVRLLGRLPDIGDSVRALTEQSERYLEQRLPLRGDVQDQVEIWSWDDDEKQPARALVPSNVATRLLAARLAREAFRIAPDDPDVRSLYLVTMLEQAAFETGLDKPLATAPGSAADRALALGVGDFERALVYSLENEHPAAATAIVRLIGRLGTAAELLHQGPEMSPLVRAVRHPDRRLSFAAAETVLALEPTSPFAGSSFVPELLSFAASTRGTPRAIVAAPSLAEAQRVAGYLPALGYEVDVATTGRDLIRHALASPDYELALVAASLGGPAVNILLQQLRHIPRTASLPVGVLAEEGQREKADRMIGGDRLAAAFTRPHRQEDVQWIVGQVLGMAGPQPITFAERQAQAARAVSLLAEISRNRRLYNVLRIEDALLTAQHVPSLTSDAAAVLGTLGTADSQKALVDLASRGTISPEARGAAAAAFCGSVERFGILLTTEQILEQYERYNQSSRYDPSMQRIMGSILDCIEAPSRQLPVAEQVSQPDSPGGSVQR